MRESKCVFLTGEGELPPFNKSLGSLMCGPGHSVEPRELKNV